MTKGVERRNGGHLGVRLVHHKIHVLLWRLVEPTRLRTDHCAHRRCAGDTRSGSRPQCTQHRCTNHLRESKPRGLGSPLHAGKQRDTTVAKARPATEARAPASTLGDTMRTCLGICERGFTGISVFTEQNRISFLTVLIVAILASDLGGGMAMNG